eukprot:6476333-Amphidinium_carterae.1
MAPRSWVEQRSPRSQADSLRHMLPMAIGRTSPGLLLFSGTRREVLRINFAVSVTERRITTAKYDCVTARRRG